jgi:hypothetical protein
MLKINFPILNYYNVTVTIIPIQEKNAIAG